MLFRSYNVGWTASGEWLKYSVNAIVDGTYSLAARVASQGNAGTFHVEIDGQNVTGAITVTNTGTWQTYTTYLVTNIAINAGPHEVRLSLDASGANGTVGNYNYLNFTATATNPPVVLQSAPALTASFLDDASALVNTATKTITVPKTINARFYRLRHVRSTQIISVQIVGTNVVMTYQ